MEAKGIDVSYFQGYINWQQVSQNQIEFAMVRATYGTTGTDGMFARNMDEIKKTDIHPGAYHYCYAMNTTEAVHEAQHFINTIKSYELHYPAALDLEEASIAELGKEAVTDIIIAFVDTLKSANYYPILYVDVDWIKNYIDMSRIPDLDIWLSDWGPKMQYSENVTIWQYSSDGNVPGINDRVDMDISYKDYPSIIKGKTDDTDDDTDDDGDTENLEGKPFMYLVKNGDSLWSIAEKLLDNGERYREIMAVNGLKSEIIKPGQLLRIPQNQGSGIILYRVRQGDNLWDLAQKFMGDGNQYHAIVKLNGLTSDTIYPGQILRIPVEPEKVTITYQVKKGDTLRGISRRFLGDADRYREIMSLNGLNSDTIYPGQNLKIPSR